MTGASSSGVLCADCCGSKGRAKGRKAQILGPTAAQLWRGWGSRRSRCEATRKGGSPRRRPSFFRNTLREICCGGRGRAKGRKAQIRGPKAAQLWRGWGLEAFACEATRKGSSPRRRPSFFLEYLARDCSGSRGRAKGRKTQIRGPTAAEGKKSTNSWTESRAKGRKAPKRSVCVIGASSSGVLCANCSESRGRAKGRTCKSRMFLGYRKGAGVAGFGGPKAPPLSGESREDLLWAGQLVPVAEEFAVNGAEGFRDAE